MIFDSYKTKNSHNQKITRAISTGDDYIVEPNLLSWHNYCQSINKSSTMKLLFFLIVFCVLPVLSFGQLLNDGTLVKSEVSPEIYLVINRHLHHVPNMNVLEKLFIPSPNIQSVSPMTLELLPKGAKLEKARLIKASNMAVFVQYDKYKIHIPNPETFIAYSFDWGKITNLSDEEISKYITLFPIVSILQPMKCEEPKPCGTND